MEHLHATAVDIAGNGVLICGPSGAGKSDLALRLIDRGATFISDDQVMLERTRRGVFATAPASIRGWMEVRGLGVIGLPVAGGCHVRLIVELVAPDRVPRLPIREERELLGEKIPLIRLNAFEVSTPIKIELAAGDTFRIGGAGPDDDANGCEAS